MAGSPCHFVYILTPDSTSISTGTGSGLPSLYVKPTVSGAQVDPEFLVSKQERKLANTPRCVEDPVAARVKAAKVSSNSSIFFHAFMRKIIPKNLDAELGPRLGCLLCIYDSTHIV